MLQVKNLTYDIGGRRLLDAVDWVIQPGARLALVGPNGAGKTTLLRLICGELEAPAQSLQIPKNYRIGYLPQESTALERGTVMATVLAGQLEAAGLESEIERLHQRLADEEQDQENLLRRLGEAESRYRALDGYSLEAQAASVLSGLGFSRDDFSRPLAEMSGGWRMRAMLAGLLLRRPELLLLDEPTNHLDLPSLEWLEQYLPTYPGAIVAVSHDRFFIDRLAREIVELDRGRLTAYNGNYAAYEEQKQTAEDLLRKKWQETETERERQLRFINRFRYQATKAAQVQSRIKSLEKLEKVELPPPAPRLSFDIRVETQSFREVLHIRDLSFRYEETWVLQELNLDLQRGEKVCLVGVNGAGKTTLTKLLAGQLQPQKGRIKIGERVIMGYYAQHQSEALDLEASVYQEVAATAADCHVPRIRDILGLFQFHGEDIRKKTGVLSGGEKARVSLTRILLSPVNFLVMDEPTNHLDKTARAALEEALGRYNGTLLLISHDRYLLDKLVSRVLELKDGRLTEYLGNYSEYLARRRQECPDIAETVFSAPAVEKPPPGRKNREQKKREAEARQLLNQELQRLRKVTSGLEDKIAALELERKKMEDLLSDAATYRDSGRAVTLQKDYSVLRRELEQAESDWEKSQTELEARLAEKEASCR